jgi:excisionase family DNA binding protein
VSDWGNRRQPGVAARLLEDGVPEPRFLQLSDVAEVLNISASQTYALVRGGDLPAIKVGGRGQWRVERSALEEYIQRLYVETKAFVSSHPLGAGEGVPED